MFPAEAGYSLTADQGAAEPTAGGLTLKNCGARCHLALLPAHTFAVCLEVMWRVLVRGNREERIRRFDNSYEEAEIFVA
jgi:hypothetical protein